MEDKTIRLPRILCLHGGGTNATIFRAQCRRLSSMLGAEFRLIFAEAPFDSQAGPDVLSVYREWGPFKRWLRWKPEHPTIAHDDALADINRSIKLAIQEDNDSGATGEVVAILGFSQGAKIAASLLYRQQNLSENYGIQPNGPRYRFGVLLAGRAPLVDMNPSELSSPGLPDTSQITDDPIHPPLNNSHTLRIPTVHVHGLKDQGLQLHRDLTSQYCAPGSTRVVEWAGDHRVPIKKADVELVVKNIRDLARLTM